MGPTHQIDLPDRPILVYYESPHNVAVSRLILYVKGPYGERIRPRSPDSENSYHLRLTGWSGRSVWELDLAEPGTYEFRCSNADYASDAEVPEEDRVVFMKEPRTLAEARSKQRLIYIVGGIFTLIPCIIFYVLHGLALRADRRVDLSVVHPFRPDGGGMT